MARHEQDGGPSAARAGAGNSLPEMPAGLKKACELDRTYFRANPRARSYTRPYIEGECLQVAEDARRPMFVAVAFVSAGIRTKVAVYDRAGLAWAKREAEARAAQWRDGAARGMSA